MKKQAAVESVAEAYLEILSARGIKYFFGNGGTDFGPVVDAYAKRLNSEAPVPTPITCPHEIPAVAMAHGYTMVTGEPQVVMVHTIAGTANAIGGVINASRTGIPMLFSAGRNPLTEGDMKGSRDGGIHWAQESFDQGSMVREWTKWDYELRHGADIEGVVDRMLAITQTEPKGPVYLTLPREVLAEAQESITYSEHARMTPSDYVGAPDRIAEAAAALATAKNPVLITRQGGKDPASVAQLVRLAEAINLPIFDVAPSHMNFPTKHRLHQGGDVTPYLADADVVVILECDVPWTPKRHQPNDDATIIAIGSDPLYSNYPIRGFPVTVGLAGNTPKTLSALADAVLAHTKDGPAIEQRGKEWAAKHDKVRADIRARAEAARTKTPLDKAWVTHCVEQIREPNDIIVTEIGFDVTQFELTEPGTLFGPSVAGVLGWSIGAALGAKLAKPDSTVIACMGDGSYMFGVPSATHWISRKYDLPVLYIVWNNSQWGAVANATRQVYPDGWAVKTDSFPFSDLSPSLDFEQIVVAAGGYSERVESPDQVQDALQRALHAVKVEKRQAVLNMVAAPR